MTDSKTHERCICRVYISASDLAKEGMPLPHGAEILRIMPVSDIWNDDRGFFDHVMILRHEDLPEVPIGQPVPLRRIVVEVSERELGAYTKMVHKKARFE